MRLCTAKSTAKNSTHDAIQKHRQTEPIKILPAIFKTSKFRPRPRFETRSPQCRELGPPPLEPQLSISISTMPWTISIRSSPWFANRFLPFLHTFFNPPEQSTPSRRLSDRTISSTSNAFQTSRDPHLISSHPIPPYRLRDGKQHDLAGLALPGHSGPPDHVHRRHSHICQ